MYKKPKMPEYFINMINRGWTHEKVKSGVHVFKDGTDLEKPTVVVALGEGRGRYICREVDDWWSRDATAEEVLEGELDDFLDLDCSVFWSDTKRDVSEHSRAKVVGLYK